ncbi:MAG: hypothetical protein R3D84_07990 [Paracoccaceae bacterium]
MIHANDQDFKGEAEASFHEAYMTHTRPARTTRSFASMSGAGRWNWKA